MSFGGGGDSTTIREPYAPSQPALNQIIGEAQNAYDIGGVQYAAPSDTTLTGLATAENLGAAAAQQQAATLAGQFTNPFLSPLIQSAGEGVYNTVASQFSGAGRTPGSPLMQQTVADQVASKALPYAFQSYNQERSNQLNLANQLPSQFNVGRQIDSLELQRQQAPFQTLSAYSNIINPIATGLPAAQNDVSPDRLTQAAGLATIFGLLR
tara:strand:+ start:354 stop:983 length:630 start_codon:yes stop_codon:yes gene_type:complete